MNTIFCNQLGYLKDAKKVATLFEEGTFFVCNEKDEVVFEGKTTPFGLDEASGDNVCQADFSALCQEGKYYLKDEKGNKSYQFEIGNKVYDGLHYDLMRALYYQRCGCALEEKYAGVYKHAICHTGLSKVYSDQSIEKDMTGGWHDAGDFGRYTTPAAVTIGHILYAYLLFPKAFEKELNIPETGNGVNDTLNECRYELEWMLKMQREDGAVYHKLTAFSHCDFIMPEDDHDQFYMFEISALAAADFAASMALAYRVYKDVDLAFAEKMLAAAKKAYKWLQENPEYLGFHNPQGSNTGEYDDSCDLDERLWAAAEMFVTTGEACYEEDLNRLVKAEVSKTDFGWTDVSGFASLTILTNPDCKASKEVKDILYNAVINEADRVVSLSKACGYLVPMVPDDYVWGSNMVVSNRGILLVLASLLKKDEPAYLEVALNTLHYLLGQNATDYSYITGEGENAFKNPHNRPTIAAKLSIPMPGFVSGGPFKTPVDEAAIRILPKGTKPMKSYVDDIGSYSTNEITIYWNSSVLFVVSAFLGK